ncbi:MAG: class II glutamine amidotransferase [Deltaproteobacteria bacterium]|nr:class II glutamine amidotransferase [Deltaproteobacteria bacterium]
MSDLLFEPDSALVRQAYAPQKLGILNLAGFGMVAWLPEDGATSEPLTYRSTDLPMYDPNLRSLSEKLHARCLLAHVRGIPYSTTSNYGRENLHPFRYAGFNWAMAHNGDLADCARMRAGLLPFIQPTIAAQIRGSTDSEWVYALWMSQLDDPTEVHATDVIVAALRRTLEILASVRADYGIDISSSANLFLTDGTRLIALRFAFDYGRYRLDDPSRLGQSGMNYLSLWYAVGDRFAHSDGGWRMDGEAAGDSLLVASEPLTHNVAGWVEVPEYTAIVAALDNDGLHIDTVAMDI